MENTLDCADGVHARTLGLSAMLRRAFWVGGIAAPLMLLGPTWNVAMSEVAAISRLADRIIVTVALDADGIEKGLTGTHTVRMQGTERSTPGDGAMTVGCVPCLNIFMSFVLADGRLYAMHPETDNRRRRYRAFINDNEVPVEAMNGLRGRDWVDAFGGVNRVPGCARQLAKGQDLDVVARRGGVCLAE